MQKSFKKHIKLLSLAVVISAAALLGSCDMTANTPSERLTAPVPEQTISAVSSSIEEGSTLALPEVIDYASYEDEVVLPPESIGDPAVDMSSEYSGVIRSPESSIQKYEEYKTLKEAEEKARKEAEEKAKKEKEEAERKAREAAEKKAAEEAAKKAQESTTKTSSDVKITTSKSTITSVIKNTSISSSKVTVSGKNVGTDTSALLKAIKSRSAKCSVLAIRLRDGAVVGYNADMKIRCKSTVKVVSALYAYKQYEAGKISMDATKAYEKKFYFGGAGKIRNSSVGTKYTLKTLINYSIMYSDNSAYLMVNDFFDMSSVKKMMKDMGCTCYNDVSEAWPMINARDAALWWNEIYNYCKSTKSASGLWNACLNACGTQVKQALGMKYSVAHKTGSGDGYYHDAGIVLSGDPYIYVILTYDSSAGNSTHKSYMMKIASALHNLINP